jgi:glycosyltransferase involved in cell wall biosynthesis
MRKWLYCIALIMALHMDLSARVRILTFHFNCPDFIELQYKTLNKFLKDDFELIVFNDACKESDKIAIESMCKKYNIQCVRFEPEWHRLDPLNDYIKACLDNPDIYSHIGFHTELEPPHVVLMKSIYVQPSIRHCHVIQYALDNYGYNHDDIVAIMDGDAFFIRPTNLHTLLKFRDIIGIQKLISTENVDYLWVVFVAFDPRTLPDLHELRFHADVIAGKLYDSGAHSFHYLAAHPTVRVKKYLGQASTGFYHWTSTDIQRYGFNKREIGLIKDLPWPQSVEFHLNKHILHFGASSFELEGHSSKKTVVQTFMNKILKDGV